MIEWRRQYSIEPDDVQARTVYPDIIVHHRETKDNLLVIEIKKTSCNQLSNDLDVEKLKEYKRQLGYTYAIFVRFKTGGNRVGVNEAKLILMNGYKDVIL